MTLVCEDRPTFRFIVVVRTRDAGIELDIAPQIESIRDMIQIFQDLRLRRVTFGPLPLLFELWIEGIGIGHTFGIATCPGVAIPVPSTTDPISGFKNLRAQA